METTLKTPTTYKDIYEEVTDIVIKALEEGTVIWQCSWNEFDLPKNYLTNTYYRGWNIFILNFHAMRRGFETTNYLTYKQANILGGTIKRGEKGVKIIYWATISPKDEAVESVKSNEKLDERKVVKLVPKSYVVFNIAQTEGIEFVKDERRDVTLLERKENCEKVVKKMPNPPKINLNGDNAYYQPSVDLVVVPSLERSRSVEGYYSTLFHELAHSTGHISRLNRKELMESDGFGKTSYAKEELTAEMTAAYLCAITGIGQPILQNSVAYIANWLKVLKNDKTLVIKAASQAQKAADFIMGSNRDII